LKETLEVEVVVIGGGIAGLTTALALKRRGLTVAVVEAARIATGVTGNTTGKVTSLHRLAYTGLADRHGRDAARVYGWANQAAIEHIAKTVAAEAIDCDFRRVANYTYAESEELLDHLRAEASLAAELGLPSTFTTDVPLPFPAHGAVRFDNQAKLHAVHYLQGLARSIHSDGSAVFEESRVHTIQDGSPAEVRTDDGVIRARDVVVATNLPIGDEGRFAERCTYHRSYIVANALPDSSSIPRDATFISADDPMRSMLTTRQNGTDYVLVGGEGHPTPGRGDSAERFGRLAAFARERLGAGDTAYRWSTQDCMPVDGLPFAGLMSPDARHVYTITGLRKWGLTNGTAAGLVVADLISGDENPWAKLFDSTRSVDTKASAPSGRSESTRSIPDLGPGQGAVVELDGEKTAVYADDSGKTHAISAVCTHLGCTVEFNSAESTWDCPCHGSRFSLEGSVIHGPAEKDLAPRELPRSHADVR
jgi:glycine/D-amino acid oxidase-like deaminating enzyme/nitrite reductase/ring-hydroxylating ferredoxin subunit